MANIQDNQEPSENLPASENPPIEDGGKGQPEEGDKVLKLLHKMEVDIDTLKGNTTSQKNLDALDRMEKSLDRVSNVISDFMAGTWDKLSGGKDAPVEEQRPDPTPTTPDIEVPNAITYKYVRKLGGRVVKRQVKEGSK